MEAWVFLLQNDGVHPIDWAVIGATREELFAFDCTCHDVANQGVLLGKISGEVHLLPLESLPDAQPRESEVRANRGSLHEVQQTVYKSNKYGWGQFIQKTL